MNISPPCPISEQIRDKLLGRFDAHFADDEVKDRLRERLDVSATVLTAITQHVAGALFAEAFDDEHDGPPGLIPRNGLARAGAVRMRAYAESLGV